MFQLDFEAFYDAIPLPENIRNIFVFKAKDGYLYCLTILPTVARWSVTVGQGITWAIVDIGLPIYIDTLIDNIPDRSTRGEGRFVCGSCPFGM